MEKTYILEIVISSLQDIISEQVEKFPMDNVNESTRLFGPDSLLDSLSLVSLIIDVEQKIGDRYGINMAIADERAMSREKSPFRTIGTLAEYVQFLVEEKSKNV